MITLTFKGNLLRGLGLVLPISSNVDVLASINQMSLFKLKGYMHANAFACM
jgi:hypothetical protein